MKRKATIMVETERLLVFSNSRNPIRRWCESCESEVDFITVEEAAALAGTTQRKIFHLAEVNFTGKTAPNFTIGAGVVIH